MNSPCPGAQAGPDGRCVHCGRRARFDPQYGREAHVRGRIAGVSPWRLRRARPQCESVRGEWGGICPDCGQRLPARPGPPRSWMSQRNLEGAMRWDGAPMSERGLAASRGRRGRAAR